MELNIELTRNDYLNFNKYYFFKKKFKKQLFWIVVMSLGLPLIITTIGRPFNIMAYLKVVIIYIIIFGLTYPLGLLLSFYINKRLPSSKGSILGEKKFIITDEGLIEECETNKNLQRWNSIKSIETNNKLVIIFIDNIVAYVIPKRYFKDETEQNNFIQTLKEKVENARSSAVQS